MSEIFYRNIENNTTQLKQMSFSGIDSGNGIKTRREPIPGFYAFYSNMIKLKDKVACTDPCYDLDTWCQHIHENMKEGDYIPSIMITDNGTDGTRVALIMIEHVNEVVHRHTFNDFVKVEGANIGVDSGQAGFFEHDKWLEQHINKETFEAFYEKTSLTKKNVMTMNNETTLSPEEICKDDYIFKVPANVTWPEVKPCLKCGAEGTTIYTPKDDTF